MPELRCPSYRRTHRQYRAYLADYCTVRMSVTTERDRARVDQLYQREVAAHGWRLGWHQHTQTPYLYRTTPVELLLVPDNTPTFVTDAIATLCSKRPE